MANTLSSCLRASSSIAATSASKYPRNLENAVWVTYRAVNPLNDAEEDVRVWMSLHDGHVFGTAFYESGWRPNP